jgi:replicative DNA helicase
MKTQETLILENLINNEDYSRKVFPFLKEEYFTSLHHKLLFQKIQAHFLKYNSLPTKTSLTIEIEQVKNISEDTFKQCIKELEEFSDTKSLESIDWLLDTTENFCKDMALYLALAESLSISKDDDKKLSKTAIPELLSKALAVSFDTNVGHSYVDDAEIRYNFFHSAVSKVPFHLDIFNTITNGGCERKTANCLAAGTGIGKSMLLCDFAANYIKNGYNVIYITMEMAEEKIAQRIDANLMNIAIQDIGTIAKPMWDEKIERIKANCKGKLIIKEYPTGSANVGHFRYLIKELKQKQNFVPDIIIIDYLNICSSAKYKDKSNSYGYIKSICEEIRGLAVEQNVVLWSATQLNRCVLGDTKVITEDGQEKFIKDIKVGDKLLGKNGIFNTVLNKYINPNTKVYKITTKSGKQIICSANHLFPTEDGKLKSIDDGLNVGDNLLIN